MELELGVIYKLTSKKHPIIIGELIAWDDDDYATLELKDGLQEYIYSGYYSWEKLTPLEVELL